MNKAINQQSFTTLTRMLTSNVLTKRKSTSRKPLQGHAQKYWIHYEDNCDTINTTYKTCSISEVLVSKLHSPATISCNSCFSSTTSWLCKPIVYHTSDFSDTPKATRILIWWLSLWFSASIQCTQGIIQSDGWNLLSKLSQFGDSKGMKATKIYLKGSR